MTKQLIVRLQEECKALEFELKNTLPKEIKKAAALGDLSENAEYESALQRQNLVQNQIRKLKARISEVAMIDVDHLPSDRINYGAVVKLLNLDDDREITYQLVMPEDADTARGRISVSSPIGRSLIGKQEGDEVEIRVPSGIRHFEVLEITPYAETEKDL